MIVVWVTYTISTGMLIAGIGIGYFLGRYNRNAKAIIKAWDESSPSLEKAMKEGEKDNA